MKNKPPVEAPRALAPDEELAPVLSLCHVNQAMYQWIVENYLGAGLRTVNRRIGGLVLALVSNGAVVGLIHYEQKWRWNGNPEDASLKLDLAVPSDRYKRLAKLVLRVALSREVRAMLETMHKRRVTHAVTSVFSQHPESMKYRGLFKQTDREHLEDGRYRLRYRGEFTDKTVQESYKEWLKEEYKLAVEQVLDAHEQFGIPLRREGNTLSSAGWQLEVGFPSNQIRLEDIVI